jgi:hypothetical protein
MNTTTSQFAASPVCVESDGDGRRCVTLSDGRSVELEAFRDQCRDQAQQLREQAIDEFFAAVNAAIHRRAAAVRRTIRKAGPSTAPRAFRA